MTELYSGLHVGQRFTSLEDFKTVIRSISVRQHWELRVIRSNKKSVVIGCRSGANCFFRVVCRSNKNSTYITSLQDNHSCRRGEATAGMTPARSEASHVRFLLSEIPKLFDMNTRIKGQEVVDAVKRYHGYDISMRQAQRALTKLQPRQADSQGEQSLDLDMSAVDQHSPAHSQPESQASAGPAYRDISENRWMQEPLQPPLIDDTSVDPTESSTNHSNAPAAAQSIRSSQIAQAPGQSVLGNPRPITVSQSGVGYSAGPALPIAAPGHPKPSDYTQRNDHGVPQMGNVTGAGYMPHPSVPNQSAVTRHPGPAPPNGPGTGSHEVAEDGGYAISALSARDMHNAWAAGGLGVPIDPSNT
ncbi:hypothetical protein N7526_011246 [Penicillium atrosanguineum]|nr:hypothetical protein N7526_011246 [Penicillium atrosanguineum]